MVIRPGKTLLSLNSIEYPAKHSHRLDRNSEERRLAFILPSHHGA